jgi:methylenetetrahydrofolate reductase (NADPH)
MVTVQTNALKPFPDRLSPVEFIQEYSLEMNAKDIEGLESARHLIPAKTAISITFLANENKKSRIEAASTVKRLGFIAVPHISARQLSSLDELKDFLARLSEQAGIERVFVIAGDAKQPLGPFEDALAVIRSGVLQDYGVQRVGISGYPEGHPEIPENKLWQALQDKKETLDELGLDCDMLTQFSFDSDAILRWLARLRQAGVAAPVRIGLPGPANVGTLLRYAARCGVGASTKVISKYGLSITKLFNTAGPDKLIEALALDFDLRIHGTIHAHLYPFGGFLKTAGWAHEFAKN